MSHTEGKLETSDRYIVKGLQVIATCISAHGFVDSGANARRLVACWNAMLPFTTEQIEQNEAYLSDLIQERDALVKERDELISILRRTVKYANRKPFNLTKEIDAVLTKYPEAS
jgi:hypothetical protein